MGVRIVGDLLLMFVVGYVGNCCRGCGTLLGWVISCVRLNTIKGSIRHLS